MERLRAGLVRAKGAEEGEAAWGWRQRRVRIQTLFATRYTYAHFGSIRGSRSAFALFGCDAARVWSSRLCCVQAERAWIGEGGWWAWLLFDRTCVGRLREEEALASRKRLCNGTSTSTAPYLAVHSERNAPVGARSRWVYSGLRLLATDVTDVACS